MGVDCKIKKRDGIGTFVGGACIVLQQKKS